MKRSERGFTLMEVMVTTGIIALIVCGAATATVQTINVTRRSNDHVAAVRQVQNAGYWISRDALMAENAVVGDDPETEEELEFLTLNWAEWDYDDTEDSEYHEVTYLFPVQDLSGGIGKLKRQHITYDYDGGKIGDETNLIAKHIYYNPDDTTYDAPVLTMRITASLGEASETKEYRVKHRPDF